MDQPEPTPKLSLDGSRIVTISVRPGIVELVALYQFAKAALLIFTFALVVYYPSLRWESESFWQAVYVASNGGGKPGYQTLAVGLYAVAVGWGLWNLKKWARYCLMVTSGMTAALWIRYLSLNFALGWNSRGPKTGFERESVYMLIMVDVIVFCCLALYPDVAESFGRGEK